MEKIIKSGLIDLNLAEKVPENASQQLARYGKLLLEKNQVMNLTAIRDEIGVAQLHMLDSATLLNYADLQNKTLIDVGTGAGFPGMVLKTLVPSLSLTLLDSLKKRLDWLEEVGEDLGLEDISTVHARAEEQAMVGGFRDSYDFATARAVADLRALAELCLPYVKIGGYFLAMKSAQSDQEIEDSRHCIAHMGGEIADILDYTIPGTKVTHRVVKIKKIAPTPDRYPRKWAKIQKSPL